MKTTILMLILAASLAQVINIANAQEVPTPVVTAGQYNGGVLVSAEPLEGVELYYFWRDGAMIAIQAEPDFIDYPSWGAPPTIYAYQVQVSIDFFSGRGELSAPVYVDLSDPCQPNGCPCDPCDPFSYCYDPFAICE